MEDLFRSPEQSIDSIHKIPPSNRHGIDLNLLPASGHLVQKVVAPDDSQKGLGGCDFTAQGLLVNGQQAADEFVILRQRPQQFHQE